MASVEPKKRRKFDVKFKEKVLEYAAEHSGEKAAKHFNIDSKRIRYWRKQKMDLAAANKKRARLSGGGRKKVSEEMDTKLSEWIHSMRDNHNRVSRKMIRNKALEIYPTVSDQGARFLASRGWLKKFLNRNCFALRRRTTMVQKDPGLLTEKLVSFVDHVGKTLVSKGISQDDIIAMDETTIWFDVVSQHTTGHVKSHLTVVLAAKADGTKLKPFVVFRGANHEVEAMQQETPRAIIATSTNGWMNDDMTAQWLRSVLGMCTLRPHLLVWDAYHCHISTSTQQELMLRNISTAVIPGGCTKYIQAPDVMWNQPFIESLRASYDEWKAGDVDKQYTSGGNLLAPSRHLLVTWVLAAWEKLDKDLVIKSFKVCGQSVKPDGSEDDLILCFKEGQPCAGGRQALTAARLREVENAHAPEHEEDEDELYNNELVVDAEASDEEITGLKPSPPVCEFVKMSCGQTLESEEELCRSKEENQSKEQLLHKVLGPRIVSVTGNFQIPWTSPGLGLKQEITETPRIKEEPEEQSVKQEEEQLPVSFPESSAVCVKTEESSVLQQRQTEHREETQGEDVSSKPHFHSATEEHTEHSSDTDNDDDWESFSRSAAQRKTEADGDHYNQVQSRDRSSKVSRQNKSVPDAAVHSDHMSGGGGADDEKKHHCPFCNKGFTTKFNLEKHIRVHTGERPYSCSTCGKTFSQKANLETHKRTHTGEKPYSCSNCDKCFGDYSALRQHSRTHTGERPYSCSICEKTFTRKGGLVIHRRQHTGEKPYSCSKCNKCFASPSVLNQHSWVHRGETFQRVSL